jgi:hypothetical protein
VHRFDDAGEEKILEGHEPADGEEGVHGGRSLNERMAWRFKVLDELIEPVSDEQDDQEEGELYRISQGSDVFPLRGHARIIHDGDQMGMMLIISLLYVLTRTSKPIRQIKSLDAIIMNKACLGARRSDPFTPS